MGCALSLLRSRVWGRKMFAMVWFSVDGLFLIPKLVFVDTGENGLMIYIWQGIGAAP